ncbi:hypothetical protein ACLBXM_17495 [Xanthobacteraceae bacterium A53D]
MTFWTDTTHTYFRTRAVTPARPRFGGIAARWRWPLAVTAALMLLETARLIFVVTAMPTQSEAEKLCAVESGTYAGLSPDPLRWAVSCAKADGTRFTVVVPLFN